MANNYKQKVDKSIRFRGQILNDFANMELLLNMYIAKFFCGQNNDKINQMQILILGDERIGFKSKLDIFVQIAQNNDKQWYDSYNAFGKHMKADIFKAMEQRNILAHRIIDNDVFLGVAPDDVIRLVMFKDDIAKTDYTEDSIRELSAMIHSLTFHFAKKFK